jgi:hypothetical protein
MERRGGPICKVIEEVQRLRKAQLLDVDLELAGKFEEGCVGMGGGG